MWDMRMEAMRQVSGVFLVQKNGFLQNRRGLSADVQPFHFEISVSESTRLAMPDFNPVHRPVAGLLSVFNMTFQRG
jgi:hypothetical protein